MEVVKIEDKELQVKEWNGKRVVTFKEIDELHKRPSGTARGSFKRNKDRLIEGEDYFSLDYASVSIIRSHDNCSFGDSAKHGIVIAESGYLMLVKTFEDDLAWKVQRQLVNGYFVKTSKGIKLEDYEIELKKYRDALFSGEISESKFNSLRKSIESCMKIKSRCESNAVANKYVTPSSTSTQQKLQAPSCIDNPKFLETLMFLAETEERFSPSRCYELFCNKVPGLKKEFGTSNVMSQKLKAGLVDKFGVVFSSERRSLGRLWAFRKINVDADEV